MGASPNERWHVKCLEAERLIEDFHYRELSGRQAREVEAHLAGCRDCSRLLELLRSEDQMYEDYGKSLDSSLDVAPSMWERIHAGLAGESAPAGRSRDINAFRWLVHLSKIMPGSTLTKQVLFASLLVLISVGGTLLVVYHHRGPGRVAVDRNAPVQAQPEGQKDLESALLAIQRAEQQYNDALGILSSIVDKRKSTLDPALAAELERNLKAIDEILASTREAYHAHPADPELAHYMLTAYQKKVELLQELAS